MSEAVRRAFRRRYFTLMLRIIRCIPTDELVVSQRPSSASRERERERLTHTHTTYARTRYDSYVFLIHDQWRYTNPHPHPQRFSEHITSNTLFLTMIFTESLWVWVWVSVTPLSVVHPR